MPLFVTISALVLTAGLGGVLIWSGIDTLDGVSNYEMSPTAEGLADGRSREERTNWLIAGTSVAGAATFLLMLFTDWEVGEASDSSTQVSVGIQGDGLQMGLRGSF